MVLMITITAGVIFALLGLKKTFYPMWALLFNVLLAIYAAVMLTPVVLDKFETLGYFGNYSRALSLLAIALSVFVVAQLLTFRFLTAVYCVSFPVILNNAGAGILGFITGFVISNFVIFLISVTPILQNPSLQKLSSDAEAGGSVNSHLISTCNVINKLSLQCYEKAPEEAVEYITEHSSHPAPPVPPSSGAADSSIPEPNE